MHYLIRLLVEGENKEEARSNAEAAAVQLVQQGQFDWFVERRGRWSECWKPVLLSRVTGHPQLQAALKATGSHAGVCFLYGGSLEALRTEHEVKRYMDGATTQRWLVPVDFHN